MVSMGEVLVGTYVFVSWFVLPSIIFMLTPVFFISPIYLFLVAAYGCTCVITSMETLTAMYWRLCYHEETHGDSVPPSLTYLIPAFLDNEVDILDDTLMSYSRLKYSGDIHVIVVYNTRKDMKESEDLLFYKWDGKVISSGSCRVSYEILCNQGSSSKAENVNFAISRVRSPYVGIMDADHFPDASNAHEACRFLSQGKHDIVQGVCTIRNHENFLSNVVAVEFDDMYCIGHEGRCTLFDLGVFAGSNGFWKTNVLQEIKMDTGMLTEDIDSSIRAMLKGYKIGFCSKIITSELSPLTKVTHAKQRKRWSQGWLEVSNKHFIECVKSPNISLRQKIGVCYLLAWREYFTYFTFWPLICMISMFLRGTVIFEMLFIIIGASVTAVGVAKPLAIYALAIGPIKRKKGVTPFIVYLFISMFYSIYLYYIQIVSHGRHLVKMNTWVATERDTKSSTTKITETPSLTVSNSSSLCSIEDIYPNIH